MKKKSNLTLFMKQLIRSLKEEERFSTAHIYQSTNHYRKGYKHPCTSH